MNRNTFTALILHVPHKVLDHMSSTLWEFTMRGRSCVLIPPNTYTPKPSLQATLRPIIFPSPSKHIQALWIPIRMHVRKLLALWHQSEIDFVYPYALNPGAWIPRLQNVALDQGIRTPKPRGTSWIRT